MKKSKNKLPKYPNGGLTNYGQTWGNMGKGILDVGLSSLGMNNIIPDSAYQGAGAEGFAKGTNMLGGIGQSVLPMALGAVGVPPQATMLAQQAGSQINKQVYAMGGQAQSIGQLEKQENTMNPDGTTTQVDLPSHENQNPNEGMPLDIGALVFTDRLKLPGTKTTYAEANKANNTQKEEKILTDKKSNNLKRLTAELMKQAKNKNSIKLFEQQEQDKQERVNKYAKKQGYQMPYGGINKYGNAGIIPPINNRLTPMNEGNPDLFNFTNQNGPFPQQTEGEYGVPQGIMQFGYQPNAYNNALNTNTNTNNRLTSMDEQDPSEAFRSSIPNLYNPTQKATPPPTVGGGNNFNWQNAAMQAGLGAISNIGNIYDLNRSKTVDKETYNRVSPTLMDPTASLQHNKQVFAKGAQDVKNASVGNSSTYIQNRKDLAINNMLTNARIKQDYDNQNQNILNQSKYYNAGTGDRETIANMQNQAQARNIKGAALNNIGQSVYNVGTAAVKDNNSQVRDQQYLKVLASSYPQLMKNEDFRKLVEGNS